MSGEMPTFDAPHAALEALLAEVLPVEVEKLPAAQANGRVLAETIRSDRDSPPCDTSAMDGYAVRLADLAGGSALPVAGEVAIGCAPPAMPSGAVLRIVTGAPVPEGADAVVRREEVDESDYSRFVLRIAPDQVRKGQHIRRQGENAPAGAPVAGCGRVITPTIAAAMAAFGRSDVFVRQHVRVGILNTGDELLATDAPAQPWQIRDSNGPGLEAVLRRLPWCTLSRRLRVADTPDALRSAMNELLEISDCVITTGGVSAGDHDYVPGIVRDCGGHVVFHKLPVRPGRPVLGAVRGRQVIFGLPGNPVSALVGMRRMILPVLRKLAGISAVHPAPRMVRLAESDGATLRLWWWRLVTLADTGEASLLINQSSGDLIAAAASDGFIEIPPNQSGNGPWPFYGWDVTN